MTVAYLLLAFGLIGIYCEFLRPGSVLPSVTGLVLFAFGARLLWTECRLPISSLLLLSAAVLLWLLDCWRDTRFVASIVASGALLCAVDLHAEQCQLQSPALLLLIGVTISIMTTILIYLGRKARRNKWSDL